MVRGRNSQKGFTLIELLLAMAVFSFVLTLCLATFIQINRLYYRGIAITKAQESARNIAGEITSRLQATVSEQPVNPLPTVLIGAQNHKQGYYCIGDVVYYYKLGVRANDIPAVVTNTDPAFEPVGGRHVLARWTKAKFCTINGPASPANFRVADDAIDLVDDNTALYQFNITGNQVAFTIAYGAPTLLDPTTTTPWNNGDLPGIKCAGGINVTFCGISHLESEAVTRTR